MNEHHPFRCTEAHAPCGICYACFANTRAKFRALGLQWYDVQVQGSDGASGRTVMHRHVLQSTGMGAAIEEAIRRFEGEHDIKPERVVIVALRERDRPEQKGVVRS